MKPLILVLVLALGLPTLAPAQAVQHGAQPNPQEVRPGSPEGDSPSTAVGTLDRDRVERRILGFPVDKLLVLGGVLVVLLIVGGIVIPVRAGDRKSAAAAGRTASADARFLTRRFTFPEDRP